MYYVRQTTKDGEIDFIPITDNNVFAECKICGCLFPVFNPLTEIAEMDRVADCFAGIELICERCLEMEDRLME